MIAQMQRQERKGNDILPRKGREASMKGATLLPSDGPPSDRLVVVSGSIELGYMSRVNMSDKETRAVVWTLPSHFFEHKNLQLYTVTGKAVMGIERQQFVIHPEIDLAVLGPKTQAVLEKSVSGVKAMKLGQRRDGEFSLCITVKRAEKWVNAPTRNPWRWTNVLGESEYTVNSDEGDCGALVVYNDEAYGMHVGTRGKDVANLFVVFTPATVGWILARVARI